MEEQDTVKLKELLHRRSNEHERVHLAFEQIARLDKEIGHLCERVSPESSQG